MRKEIGIFNEFIQLKGLRHTDQREKILDTFLSIEAHVSAQGLYEIVRKKYPEIGYTTVYRTMKLLSECGLCDETDFGDGVSRFEHKYGHEHHDHLVCVKCGRFIEVSMPEIERLQDKLAKERRFIPLKHKLQIFGICGKCSRRK